MSDLGAPDVSGTAPVGDTVTTESTTESTSDSSGGGNPAWSTLLDQLPTSLHGVVKPVLSEWDKNYQGVQSKYSEVQSQYEPYSKFAEAGFDADQIQTAIEIMSLIDSDPQAFHKQLGEFYADQWDQGQQGQQQIDDGDTYNIGEPDFDPTQHPKFQEMANNQAAIAEYLASNIEQQEQAAADAEVDQELASIKQANPNIDENMLFTIALSNNITLQEAAEQLNKYNSSIRQQPRADANAPAVFNPSGGGVPSSQPDPAKMNDKETRALVANILAQTHRE